MQIFMWKICKRDISCTSLLNIRYDLLNLLNLVFSIECCHLQSDLPFLGWIGSHCDVRVASANGHNDDDDKDASSV